MELKVEPIAENFRFTLTASRSDIKDENKAKPFFILIGFARATGLPFNFKQENEQITLTVDEMSSDQASVMQDVMKQVML
mgnify:CR=1 FL=1